MWRVATALGVIVAALACGSAAGAPPGGLESVIVRFTLPSHGFRLEALRAENEDALQSLRAQLAGWSAAGRVADVRPLWIIDGVALRATPEVVTALAHDPAVASVVPDDALPPASHRSTVSADDWNIAAIGAPSAWARGYTGSGVVVASLDTGADLSIPALAASWRGGSADWFDPYAQHTTPVDFNGHGTQALGITASVAPGAKWIAARIYDDSGHATLSAAHLALQWALDPDRDPTTNDAPQIVLNPWSASYGSCSLEFAADLQALRAANILPLFAAGNYGAVDASPANNPGAFAVGSTANGDVIAASSSRGPSDCAGAGTPFPQLSAPGESVTTTDRYGGTASVSGTSFAAAHVAGALALLLGAHPGLSVGEQEDVLERSAHDLGAPGPDDTFGYGRLDVAAALDAVLAPSFSLVAAPSSATVRVDGTATFTVASSSFNGFTGDIALSVSGVAATAAPSVVAPGGTSIVTVDAHALAPGSYSLVVEGTSGGVARSAHVALVVLPRPDFSLRLPARVVVKRGRAVTVPVRLMTTGGLSSRIGLSVRSVPGIAAALTPRRAATVAKLTLRASAKARPATGRLTIVGVAGGLTHEAAIRVQVIK